MAIKKRTDQLPAILSGDVDNNDLMYLVHENAQAETGYDSKKILVSDVGRKLNNKVEYVSELPSFPSGSQNPLDALELLKQEILDLYPVDSASGSIANFTTSLAMPLVALKAYITAQGGGGTPSAPIAITGWDNVKIYQRGGNLWDEEIELGTYNTTTGEKSASNINLRTKNKIKVKPNIKLCFASDYSSTSVLGIIMKYGIDGSYLGYFSFYGGAYEVTIPSDTYEIAFYTASGYGTTYNGISVNYPSTDTTYHAYNPNSTEYTIQLGQTCYGGYIDKGSGKLTITWGSADLGSLEWTKSSSGSMFNATISDMYNPPVPPYSNRQQGILCSIYPIDTQSSVTESAMTDKTMLRNNGKIYIKDTDYSTKEAFKAAMNGIYLVYELATPIETDITLPEITALVGENNIFADSGDIEVSFKMGVQEYIDKKIAETQALVL